MDTGLLKILRFALSSVLFGLAIWYSIRSYLKFRESIISINYHKKFPGELVEFPSVTICSHWREQGQNPGKIMKIWERREVGFVQCTLLNITL